MSKYNSHYDYLETHLDTFWQAVFDKTLEESHFSGIIIAHGDKVEQYQDSLEEAGIPYYHGCMMYMLTYTKKMGDTPKWESLEWIIDNYTHYVDLMPTYE